MFFLYVIKLMDGWLPLGSYSWWLLAGKTKTGLQGWDLEGHFIILRNMRGAEA